ncbi:ankyrin repeat, PH and SEC7 domain containing secG-like [Olea europaea subsp. europaea]|uniref:Ankyrin repeat, PH and SEC7 domain containing secG-like n=1 Tax=Olea europaea subsp. europaea TaxID=158383 RepID=A0A8S0T3X9_OLEEU|nr:ankyrin repeat, PH and SEC7 domain containing secG-like [Olea europaea subsp. europaea]
MDRLIKSEVQELNLFFIKDQKCSITFKLINLMHTMSVAISLTTSNQSKFSFSQCFSLIPPLSTASFTLFLNQPSDQPPLSMPPETVLVRSSMLPTGKAHQDDLRRLFSKPGPHIFKDATLPISFVGPHVVEFLLSPSNKSLEMNFLFSKAISRCDDSQLSSLLRFAAKNGNSYFVSGLIEAGADVNGRDLEGESALSLAVKSGNVDSVQVLIESGSIIDNKIDRFLHETAASGRIDLMETLCLGYVDIDLNSVNSQNQTALHVAAIRGHVEALQFLLSIGSDPDITDSNGWTPLHFAAHEGSVEAVEFLLNHSFLAKYVLTKEGKTAFSLAVDKGNLHLYDMLHLGDMLHRAARIDDIHTMKSCLAQGGNVNGRDQYGWTPLHRAAFKGHIESVKLLVSHGARVDLVDGAGYTPLLRAVEAGHVQVAMHLLSHGAKANLKSLKGVVPSDLECFKKYNSLVNPLEQEERL